LVRKEKYSGNYTSPSLPAPLKPPHSFQSQPLRCDKFRFVRAARYDEELTLTTRIVRQTSVRIDHAYELRRGETLLAEANTTIACVDREGQLRQIPEELAVRG
jgi:acyl-CoA thioesterase FadM